MLPIFIHPDQKPERSHSLQCLNQFIAWVRGNPILPENTRADAVKLLECFRWIKANRKSIREFVTNKSEYIAFLPPHDQANQVIRDHQGTSIHFNAYHEGEEAIRHLLENIHAFETAFRLLSQNENQLALMLVVAKCNYDKERGCMEARCAEAKIFLAKLQSTQGVVMLLDIIQLCQTLYFLNINDTHYNFVMADAFLSAFYGQSVIVTDAQGTLQTLPLTQDRLFDDIASLFSLDRPKTETIVQWRQFRQANPSQWNRSVFLKLIEEAVCIQGRAGMIQYRFASLEQAKQLMHWLKGCESLKNYQIDACRAKTETSGSITEHVVRLHPLQRDVLMGNPWASGPSTVLQTSIALTYRDVRKAARYFDDEAFQRVIDNAPPEAIHQALSLQDDEQRTVLHLTACYRDSHAFRTLIHRAPSDAINKALILQDNEQWTALHVAARYQDSPAFQALIHKASQESIHQVLLLQSQEKHNVLQLAARHQDNQAMHALMDKASREAINQSLVGHHPEKRGALHLAARYQDHTVLQAFIEKASSKTIREYLFKPNFLLLILMHQGPTIWHQLIDKANFASNMAYETILQHHDRLQGLIHASIQTTTTQTELLPWIHCLMRIQGDDRFIGLRTPARDLIKRISQRPNEEEKPCIAQIKQTLLTRLMQFLNEDTQPQTIHFANGKTLRLDDLQTIDDLEEHGALASWKDFYILFLENKNQPFFEGFYEVLKQMLTYESLALPSRELRAIDRVRAEGNLLIKLFTGWKPNAWPDFLTQLKTPEKRAELRNPKTKQGATHKFYHLREEISDYKKSTRPKPENHHFAKKQATTLISPDLCTPLFQSRRLEYVSVGVALQADPNLEEDIYIEDKAKMRALLLSDFGTYERKWRGSFETVQRYAAHVRDTNFTSLDAFKRAIQDNEKQTNEVLAQPTRQSLLAVIMGRNTPKERQTAYAYQSSIEHLLGVNLPILFYCQAQRFMIPLGVYDRIKQNQRLTQQSISLFQRKQAAHPRLKNNIQAMGKKDILIQWLTHYIERIESLYASPSSLKTGFTLFKHSRALNREANYLLACELKKRIQSDSLTMTTKDELLELRAQLIETHKINLEHQYRPSKIHSHELNDIIEHVLSTRDTTNPTQARPSLRPFVDPDDDVRASLIKHRGTL